MGIFNVTFEPGCRNNWHIHLAIEVPGVEGTNEWLEPVNDDVYGKLKGKTKSPKSISFATFTFDNKIRPYKAK